MSPKKSKHVPLLFPVLLALALFLLTHPVESHQKPGYTIQPVQPKVEPHTKNIQPVQPKVESQKKPGYTIQPVRPKHHAVDNISPFCRTANDKLLCSRLVNPVKTWPEATTKVLTATLQLAEKFPGMLPMLDKAIAHMTPASQKATKETCTEDFQDHIDNLREMLKMVDVKNIHQLRTLLTGTNTFTCQDELLEYDDITVPWFKQTALFQKMIDCCLAVVDSGAPKGTIQP